MCVDLVGLSFFEGLCRDILECIGIHGDVAWDVLGRVGICLDFKSCVVST